MTEFDKQYFQRVWGDEGYHEHFSYGLGIDRVCEVGLIPFYSLEKEALEIGSGGGTFTRIMVNNFKHLTAIDVIKKPTLLSEFDNFTYIELEDKSYDCPVPARSIDFAFSYNVFCHLSNHALKEYLKGINKALKKGADFVFMLSNYKHTAKFEKDRFQLGDLLPMGHFYQDLRTLDLIADLKQWEVVSNNLLPDHRDIVVHLRKL